MYARPRKGSHLETVKYEIDMLRFCLERLRADSKQRDQGEVNLLIEGFLLHYRNLLEFFSGVHHRSDDDLSTRAARVWAERELTGEELAVMQAPAIVLDTQYFQVISKYLQHCTEQRHLADRGWDIDGMYEQVHPILSAFEKSFLGGTVIVTKGSSDLSGSHTATMTTYNIFPERE